MSLLCRVPGCVAFAAADIHHYAKGICIGHQQLPGADLLVLLKRGTGMVAPLRPVAVGIEYERADGTQYGIDHDGNYYDVAPRESTA